MKRWFGYVFWTRVVAGARALEGLLRKRCRECDGERSTKMFYLDNAILFDRPKFEIVEKHPCPYCSDEPTRPKS